MFLGSAGFVLKKIVSKLLDVYKDSIYKFCCVCLIWNRHTYQELNGPIQVIVIHFICSPHEVKI